MSKKDLVQNLQEDYSTPVSAKGKTAIIMDGITAADITDFEFKIDGNNLVITNKDGSKGLRLSNYTKLNSIKFNYIQEGNRESWSYINFMESNLVDNTANLLKDYKKTSIIGTTDYNDKIDASQSGYTPTGKNLKKNKGLTINAKQGNDEIIGTQYNDTITGGKGNNTIIYNSKNFGIDTIKLTKGEHLDIRFEDDMEITSLNQLSFTPNKKNLEVTTTLSDGTKNKIILKDYYSKDLGANVFINGYNLANQPFFDTVTAQNYFEAGKKVKKSYTGSALSDDVDAGGLSKAVKKDTGVTINGGAGNDRLKGSNFADTIKGGAGNDTITGGKGNDKLYGISGNNTFVFNSGDGADTFYSGTGSDTFEFNDEISYEDLATVQDKKDLIVKYGEGDSIRIKNYFDKNGNPASSAKNVKTFEGVFTLESIRKGTAEIPSGEEVVTALTDDIVIEPNKNYEFSSVADGVKITLSAETLEDLDISQTGDHVLIKNGDNNILLRNYAKSDNNVRLKTANGDIRTLFAGTDNTVGTSGNDIVINSSANDTISTGVGADLYIFNNNHGQDIINYTSGNDVIKFRGVTADKMAFSQSGNDVVITTGNDKITLKNYPLNSKNVKIHDKDGVELTLLRHTGTLDDSSSGANTVYFGGDNSNDILTGGSGDDVFVAGSGDDTLKGNNGKNTYVFKKGDGLNNHILSTSGEDTIKFTDILANNLQISTTDGKFVIKHSTDVAVELDNFFELGKDLKVVGSDGAYFSILNDTNIIISNGTIIGTDAAETIAGSYIKDKITGNKGNDIIIDSYGNNEYNFNKGDGFDSIYAMGTDSREDILKFNGSTMAELDFEQTTKGLVITYNGGRDNDTNKVLINHYFDADVDGKKNKVTKFMVKGDNKIYSIEEDSRHYVTNGELGNDGYTRYAGSAVNDVFTSTNKNEIFTGNGGKNIYNFSLGGGTDYIFSTSGKDIINFNDVSAQDLTVRRASNSNDTLVISYGEASDKVILQNYMQNQVAIKITGINGTESTIADYVATLDQGLGTANNLNLSLDELQSNVVQWSSADGFTTESSVAETPVDTTDLVAVFVNN